MSTAFSALSNEILDAMFDFYPARASAMGLHAHDGRAGAYSSTALDGRIRQLSGFRDLLTATTGLSGQALDDRDNLLAAVEKERFELADLREPYRNPLFYVGLVDVSHYVKRAYAPLDERVDAMTAHLRQVPTLLADAARNLTEVPSKVAVSTAIDMFDGVVAFLQNDLPRAASTASTATVHAFEAANGGAVRAVREFAAHLGSVVRPRATDDFAIGPERYRRMMRAEMVDLDPATLHRVAEDEIARLREEFAAAAGAIDARSTPSDVARALAMDHPTEEELVPYTRGVLEGLRHFLLERSVVTVPAEADCRVAPTPPFLRWAFAMMDSAGVFETSATESYYYVTLPDPRWSPTQKEEWLRAFDRASVVNTSIHEAYPGHYLHGLHMKQAPSRAAKSLWTYTYGEGWAHYVEEMMLEEGYGSGDPKLRLATILAALTRAVRFVVSVGMHTRGLTLEAAARRFERDACLEPLPARKEAERGTFDPGYLNYTLGKLMLRRLRADRQRQDGSAFALRAFHDRYLSLGAPPFPVVRRALLADPSGPLI